jgi:hypothetical protein
VRQSNLKVVVEHNQYNGTWDVGWRSADGDFTPCFCGYPTRQAAEAEIPGFDARLEAESEAFRAEKEAEEREQNERFPNLGYVRAKIKKLRDNPKTWAASFDADDKLDELLAMDLHEHINWPLPSWKAIRSRRVYGH